jgi:hypothetical protein
MRRALAAGGLLTLFSVALSGCGSGAVEAPVPRPPAEVAARCRALHDRLPQKVHGFARRATTPKSPLVTAWGSPAIVIRCGMPRPAALKPTSELVVVNGVSWLGVPADQPPGDVLIELAGPIKAAIPASPDGSL